MKRDIARKKALPKPPKSCSFSCRGGIGASRGLGASASAAGARAMPWRSQPLSRSRRAQERPAALRQPSEGLGKGLSLIHHDPSGTGTGDEGLAGFWRSGRGFARGLPRAEPTDSSAGLAAHRSWGKPAEAKQAKAKCLTVSLPADQGLPADAERARQLGMAM